MGKDSKSAKKIFILKQLLDWTHAEFIFASIETNFINSKYLLNCFLYHTLKQFSFLLQLFTHQYH